MQNFENKRRTRMLATAAVIAMALCVLAAIVPGDADAADPSTAVAEIDGTTYQSLESAVIAADNGDVIKVISDIDLTSTGLNIPIEKDVVLDINGKQIEVANSSSSNINVYGKLTIRDTSDSAGRIFTESVYGGAYTYCMINSIGEDALIVIESGYIDASSFTDDPSNEGQFGIGVVRGGDVIINGGTITAGWYAISGNGTNNTQNSVIEIHGGELISTMDYAVYLPHSGSTYIDSGFIYGASGGVTIQRGNLEVSGDAIITSYDTGDTGDWGDGTGGLGNAALNVNAAYGNCDVTISGGIITARGNALTIAQNATYTSSISITGGQFSSDVGEYCPSGYSCIAVGESYSVGKDAVMDASGNYDASDSDNTVLRDTGVSADVILANGSVSISSTGGNQLGNMSVSIVDNSENVVDDSIARYEIDIVVSSDITYRAEITVPAAIPSGYQPLMYYIDDAGDLRPVEVLSYTTSSVTFVTDHTTPFLVFLGEEQPDFVPGWDDDDDYPIIAPEQIESDDDSEIAVIVAAAAAAAVLMCVFVLMGRGKI